MAISFINYSEYNSASSSSAIINKPTWTLDWDIMFALANCNQWVEVIFTPPSGWTKLWDQVWLETTGQYYSLYYRIASSEWTDYTWTTNVDAQMRIVNITYRWWFDTADPIDVVSNTSYTTNNNINRAASMTVSAVNSPLIFFATIYSTSSKTFTKPSVPTTDWIEDLDSGSTVSDYWSEICSMTWTSSWATDDMDATMSQTWAFKHAFAVALNPEVTWNPWAFFQILPKLFNN